MVYRPQDVKKPSAPSSKAGSARVSPRNLRNRLTQIKDQGTAGAMGKMAGELAKQGQTIRDRARQTKQNHNALAAQMSDSAARVGQAKRQAIGAKGKAARKESEAETADVELTEQQKVNKSVEKNFVGAYIPPEDDGMEDFVKLAGGAIALAGAFQEARKDTEKGIKEQQLKLRYAQRWAQDGPRIMQSADGTPEGVINADSGVAELGNEVLKEVYGDSYLQRDPDAMAAANKILMGLRTQQLGQIATTNHNNQIELAKTDVQAIIKQHGALALQTGEYETSLLNLQELKKVLIDQGLMTEKQARAEMEAAGTLIVGNAQQYLKNNNRFDEAFALVEKTQGTFTGSGENATIAYDNMIQRGMDPHQTFGILFFESNFDPNAKNPAGSASGIAQQIKSTWREGHKQTFGYYPREGSLARDYPPEVQIQVGLKVLADEQEKLRNQLGVPALSDSQAYMAHFKNANDAYQILQYQPQVSLSQIPVITPREIKDNGWMKNGRVFTVAELEEWAADKVRIGRQRAAKAGVMEANGELAEFVVPEKAAQWNAGIATAEAAYVKKQLALQQAITDAVTIEWDDKSPKNDPAGAINSAVPHMANMYAQVQQVRSAVNEDNSPKYDLKQQGKIYQEYAEKMHTAQIKAYAAENGNMNPPDLFFKYLPKAEAADMAARFKNHTGAEVDAMFDNERQRWGKYWPSVANQVAQESGSAEFQVAMMFDKWGDPTGWTNLVGVMNIPKEQIEKGLPNGVALTGKSEESVEYSVRQEMEQYRHSFMPPQVTGQVAGNLYDNMVQVATKMAGKQMVDNLGMTPRKAAQAVRKDFERNLSYIDDPRVRVVLTNETLGEMGMTMDDIQEGTDALFNEQTVTDLIGSEVMGVGDPTLSQPLRRPIGRLQGGTLDIGDYIEAGANKEAPTPSIDQIAPGTFAVSVPGQDGHYGMFNSAENASAFGLALKRRAQEMLGFDREQTLANFANSGMITASADQKGVELLVRTNGATGFSPIYNMNGMPIVIPFEDLKRLGEM